MTRVRWRGQVNAISNIEEHRYKSKSLLITSKGNFIFLYALDCIFRPKSWAPANDGKNIQ